MKNNTLSLLKSRNPYPKDLFIPPKKHEVKMYIALLEENNICPDKFAGYFMRHAWKLCCDELEKIMKELEDEKT